MTFLAFLDRHFFGVCVMTGIVLSLATAVVLVLAETQGCQ